MSKTFYQLLEIVPSAGADEIKRAFRIQIARYHPDKVQHLGQEFQEMAAERAAGLTEAYRILSDEQRRASYDATLASAGQTSAGVADRGSPSRNAAGHAAPAADPAAAPSAASAFNRGAENEAFSHDRATRDQVVRRATFGRVRQALETVGGYEPSDARGFDVAWLPKGRLFGFGKGPRLVGRMVARVDRDSIAGAWSDATKWAGTDQVCVFLMGTDLATPGELARAIAGERRRSGSSRVTVIPVDAGTWDAHLPVDAPVVVKMVLERLKTGT
jgi:curved DNA-binding protein CbpA